jgi:hypothetical protein
MFLGHAFLYISSVSKKENDNNEYSGDQGDLAKYIVDSIIPFTKDITDREEKPGPDDLAEEIEKHIFLERDFDKPGSKECRGGKAESHGQLGNEEDARVVAVKNVGNGKDFFFFNAKIFSKFADEGVAEFASEPVPDDIAHEISGHECEVYRNKRKGAESDEDTAENGENRTFDDANEDDKNVEEVLVVIEKLEQPLLHGDIMARNGCTANLWTAEPVRVHNCWSRSDRITL